MYDEFFTKAHELVERGEPFATATVVRAERPTSGKPGDKAIVTVDGVMFGWIGGSCAQPTVIQEALGALADGRSRLIRITPEPGSGPPREGLKEVAMSCFSGGTLDIYVEPQQPKPRLLIVGHLPVAQALAHLGRALAYRTIVVDPGEEGGTAMAHADEVVRDLAELAEHADASTFVVVATHGHYDEPALVAALKTAAPYVGLVASRKRAEPILEYLRGEGFGDADLARLKIPAGLDLGARRGDEIALAILAEIVQLRRGSELTAATTEETREVASAEPSQSCCGEAKAAGTAVDPVCGMTVEVGDERPSVEHEGEFYYFCCAGCLQRFSAEPEAYLAGAPIEFSSGKS